MEQKVVRYYETDIINIGTVYSEPTGWNGNELNNGT
jgi:hypothetical protein